MVMQTYFRLPVHLLLWLLICTTFTQGDEAQNITPSATHHVPNPRSAIPLPPPSAGCWTTHPCLTTLSPFKTCYRTTGPLTPTSNLTFLSLTYQACLCAPSLPYLHIISNIALYPDSNVSSCLACMQQAGVNVTDRDGVVGRWVGSVDKFCAAVDGEGGKGGKGEEPDLKALLIALLDWLRGTGENVEGNSRLGGIEGVTTLSGVGMTATKTTGEEGKTNTLERYLTQIPLNWPYTAPAVARQAGVTTRFALVDATESSSPSPTRPQEKKQEMETVGWVEASLLWFPRLLYTPRPPPASSVANQTTGAGVYNGLLEGWKPSFVVNVTTTAMESTERISVADTPVVLDSLEEFTTPIVTITSTATLHRVRPVMRRGLTKESEKSDVGSTATRSGVTTPPTTTTMAGGQQALTRATASLNNAEEIDRLWAQIEHAMSTNLRL